jgi:hypothetical protein
MLKTGKNVPQKLKKLSRCGKKVPLTKKVFLKNIALFFFPNKGNL